MNDLPGLWEDDASYSGGESLQASSKKSHRKDSDDVAIRNTKARRWMRIFFDMATRNEYAPLDANSQEVLAQIFSSKAWGFREILLMVVIARLLDEEYKASEDLYACNPRSLFEKPIRDEFAFHGIPSRQSGPLNMAKSTQKLNNQWADGRKGKNKQLAYLFVPLIERVDTMPRAELENFAVNLHALFLEKKKEQALLAIEARPEADIKHLYHLCKELIDQTPDGGNTPQRVIGLLLKVYHEVLRTGIVVSGYDDSASTTNTTSKKVGDITEEIIENEGLSTDNKIINIYEVSMKSFGEQRVQEAYDAVRNYDEEQEAATEEIIVICREKDCYSNARDADSKGIYLGKIQYKDLVFYFMEIYEWMMSQLMRMPIEARLQFYKELNEYIAHRNTALAVKTCWRKLHEEPEW